MVWDSHPGSYLAETINLSISLLLCETLLNKRRRGGLEWPISAQWGRAVATWPNLLSVDLCSPICAGVAVRNLWNQNIKAATGYQAQIQNAQLCILNTLTVSFYQCGTAIFLFLRERERERDNFYPSQDSFRERHLRRGQKIYANLSLPEIWYATTSGR